MTDLPPFLTGFFALLLISAFVRFATVFGLLRYALGLHGWTFGIITGGLSLILSIAVLSVQMPQVSVDIFNPTSVSNLQIEKSFRPFIEKHTDSEILIRLYRSLKKDAPKSDEVHPFPILASAFLLSELKVAFQIGLALIIPFLVIDLLVAHVCTLLGYASLSPATISLPLKLIIFFSVDGWTLLTERLLTSIGG